MTEGINDHHGYIYNLDNSCHSEIGTGLKNIQNLGLKTCKPFTHAKSLIQMFVIANYFGYDNSARLT